MKCDVCKKSFEFQENNGKCPRCGFFGNYQYTDEAGRKQLEEKIEAARNEFVRKITDLSIHYCEGPLEGSGDASLTEKKAVIAASGADCLKQVAWDRTIGLAQSPSDEPEPVALQLSYKFCGKEKPLPVKINPVRCNDYWHVGLELTVEEDLGLNVYLGTRTQYAKTRVILP